MSNTVRRRPTYASIPFGAGIAFVVTSAIDWPLPWMRWTLLVLGIASLVVAAVLVAIGWRAQHNPLASGSDWEPLPSVMPPDPRPPAGAPVPAPPHPPIIPGPTAVALPIPREDDELAQIRRRPRDDREPVAVRARVLALPPPADDRRLVFTVHRPDDRREPVAANRDKPKLGLVPRDPKRR